MKFISAWLLLVFLVACPEPGLSRVVSGVPEAEVVQQESPAWVIVLGMTAGLREAEVVQQRFRARYPAVALHTSILRDAGSGRYRVVFGAFESLTEALSARDRLAGFDGHGVWMWEAPYPPRYVPADWSRHSDPTAALRTPDPEPRIDVRGPETQAPIRGLTVRRADRLGQQEDTLPFTVEGPSAGRLAVFFDCHSAPGCDDEFLRTRLEYVDHARDRRDADVYVLITTQRTASSGREYTLHFAGQNQASPRTDTLRYVSRPAISDDEGRRELERHLQAGLLRYFVGTPAFDHLNVSIRPAEGGSVESGSEVRDPWRRWVFEASVGGSGNGERSFRSLDLYGSFSANRTTPEWKIEFSLDGSRLAQYFEYDDTSTFRDLRDTYRVESLIVRSLSDHLSAGMSSGYAHSSFRNQDRALNGAVAIEFNFFPYSESTRRRFTLLYEAGLTSVRYIEETIFDRFSENLAIHSLTSRVDVRQPWGRLSTSARGTHLQPGTLSFNIDSQAGLQLLRGLSLDVYTGLALLRDQRHLPKGEATREEILLRRRELETSYRYYVRLGFSYTFGSMFNNVVNPRFRT